MIILSKKEDCCGCHACETVCPKKCISMREDAEGFFYPSTDVALCINCHLCEKVCPVINATNRAGNVPASNDSPFHARVFAVRASSDALVLASSSGGAFSVIAENVIARGGVVFGARWTPDFGGVFHDFTETLDGLSAFRGSKYLQSRVGNAFKKAREFLNAGREVLFTGTPCQIAGLRRALRKNYPNLLAVDIACWKVPSPKVWREFFSATVEKNSFPRKEISDVRHRKKTSRDGKFSCADFSVETPTGTLFQKPLYSTAFGKGFASGLITRPSCAECPAKGGGSGSDLTLGDFWGVEKTFPDLDSQRGVSIIVARTPRGLAAAEQAFPHFSVVRETTLSAAIPYNGGLRSDSHKNPCRELFFEKFNAAPNARAKLRVLEKFTRATFRQRAKNFALRSARFVLARTGMLGVAKKLFKFFLRDVS